MAFAPLPGVNYSHMAMIEELPQGALSRYIVVWQASSRLAGESPPRILLLSGALGGTECHPWLSAFRLLPPLS